MDKLCSKCMYHLHKGRNSDSEIWYNHQCLKHPEKHKEYVFGTTKIDYKYCRDINPDGKCKDFKKE